MGLKVCEELNKRYAKACELCMERHKAIHGVDGYTCAFKSFDSEYCNEIAEAEKKRFGIVNRRTYMFDMSGEEIFVGDIVIVKSERTDRKIITAVVEARDDDIKGFRVKYKDGYLCWESDDADSGYEVVKIS